MNQLVTRKTNIALILTVCLFLASACKQENAAEFNDQLVEYKNKADSDFVSMNKYLNIALQEKEYNTIDYITRSAIDSLEGRIAQVKEIKPADSGEAFKKAVIAYMQSLRDVSQAYKSYAMLADSTITPSVADSLVAGIKATESEIDPALKSLINSQQEYAHNKNLKLEPNNNNQ